MHANDDQRDQSESILGVIRKIQGNALDPAKLDGETRRGCVEHLVLQGYAVVEIAEILQVSDRTIRRDKSVIRRANAIEQDPALVPEMVGQLIQHSEASMANIRRISRDPQTPPLARIAGERTYYWIMSDVIQRLQSLGYLPTAAQQIQGEFLHHLEQAPDYAEIDEEISRLQIIFDDTHDADTAGSDDVSDASRKQLAVLKQSVTRFRMQESVEEVASTLHIPLAIADDIEEAERDEHGNQPDPS